MLVGLLETTTDFRRVVFLENHGIFVRSAVGLVERTFHWSI